MEYEKQVPGAGGVMLLRLVGWAGDISEDDPNRIT